MAANAIDKTAAEQNLKQDDRADSSSNYDGSLFDEDQDSSSDNLEEAIVGRKHSNVSPKAKDQLPNATGKST